MTESFGTCEADLTSAEVTSYESLAEQAAAQGITYFVSSGDSGAEGCDSPDFETIEPVLSRSMLWPQRPTPSPWAAPCLTKAGTTESTGVRPTVNRDLSRLSPIFQKMFGMRAVRPAIAWAVISRTSLRDREAPANTLPNLPGNLALDMDKEGWRDIPDVSLTAAAGHDQDLFCLEGSCEPDAQGYIYLYAVGGTSASAPSFAANSALVDSANGGRRGHAGYILYRLAAGELLSQCNASSTSTLPNATCVFNDITSGNNAVPGEAGYGTPTAPYQSGVGYDLATGLGSVNVTNLVNKWNSITFNATTTALTLGNVYNITNVIPVSVNATVTPNSGGPPTGNLVLQGGPYSSSYQVQLFPLSGGSVISTTAALPGGNYQVTAHYAGDTTFASSDSGPIAVVVTPENSATALSGFTVNSSGVAIPFSGGVYGTFVYPRADVAGSSGEGVATGSVNFMDGTSFVAGPYTLNSQGNTAPPLGIFNFSAGSHSLTAAYSGDPSFSASTSSPVAFTITQAAGSVTGGSTQGSSGAMLTATVNTNSGGNPPSGTVTFYVDGTQVGTPIGVSGTSAIINPASDLILTGASATASYSDSSLAAGSYSLKAVYSGDANYK